MNKFKIMLLQSYICVASLSAAIVTPALPKIEKTFALSQGSVEWVMSMFLLGYVVGQLIYAPLANRFGRLPALRFGLAINILGILMCLLAVTINNYFLLLTGRLVTALGAASGLSCTFMLINELLPPEKAKQAMSFALVFFTLGIGLAVTTAGIITQYSHWEYCFLVLLLHGVIMFFSTWQFPETLKKPQYLNISFILFSYQKALASKQLVKYALVVGLNSAFAYCYSTAAPVYSQSVLHLSASHYGYWNLLNIVGMLASGFVSARLMKMWGAEKVAIFALSLLLPCLFSLGLLSMSEHASPIWFFTTTSFLYLCSGLLFPAGSILASNAIDDRASASSMLSFIYMGTAMLSVIIMGYLPFSIISAMVVVLAGLFVIVMFLLSSKITHELTQPRLID